MEILDEKTGRPCGMSEVVIVTTAAEIGEEIGMRIAGARIWTRLGKYGKTGAG